MLKGISNLISPELLKILMEMGHGDEIVFGDGNFPAASHARRLVRADGHGIPELLQAILPLFPLDTYVPSPAALMAVTPGDPVQTPIWDEYRSMIATFHHAKVELEEMERSAFYERAKQAYAIVSTGEKALYANIILKKGVIGE
ncbi:MULTISPECIES: L-fucose mutarotase [Paenibacillus]|uniref:L-fucose mutarotase n=1 Tax=Paenibacillus TaxID=44249 RepID=UPI00048ABA8D|nr:MULTISPECIES: L-fucose mutarotase [Paenibacillus]MCM3496872.1 L-fucose mutarotase [Paenibacillus lactis]GIO93701.1 fucose isomerase [Paenibacillus lactis]